MSSSTSESSTSYLGTSSSSSSILKPKVWVSLCRSASDITSPLISRASSSVMPAAVNYRGAFGHAVASYAATEPLIEKGGLAKTAAGNGAVYCQNAQSLLSLESGRVSLCVQLPADIVNGVYAPLSNSTALKDMVLWGVNFGENYITPPGFYAALTPTGIEFTIWTQAGRFTVLNTTSNIAANTDFKIDCAWGVAPSVKTAWRQGYLALTVDDTALNQSLTIDTRQTIKNANFWMLDTPTGSNGFTGGILRRSEVYSNTVVNLSSSSSSSSRSSLSSLSSNSSSLSSNSSDSSSHSSISSGSSLSSSSSSQGLVPCNTPFQMGQTISFNAPCSGYLWVRVNDQMNQYDDNSGSWTVSIVGGPAIALSQSDGASNNNQLWQMVGRINAGQHYTINASGIIYFAKPPGPVTGQPSGPDGQPQMSPENGFVAHSLVGCITQVELPPEHCPGLPPLQSTYNIAFDLHVGNPDTPTHYTGTLTTTGGCYWSGTVSNGVNSLSANLQLIDEGPWQLTVSAACTLVATKLSGASPTGAYPSVLCTASSIRYALGNPVVS